MVGCELIATIKTVACGIIKCFSTDEISILAVSFNQLGDTLATYLTQVDLANNQAAAKEEEKSKEADRCISTGQ